MPRVIDSIDPLTYPWDEWADGQAREFEQGLDFGCGVESFRQLAYVAARDRGMKVKTRTVGNKIRLQFYRDE